MEVAIILDGHLKSALSCVRSLGAQKITVLCGAERKTAMACHSKYVQKAFTYTSPKKEPQTFLKELIALAKAIGVENGEKPVVFCFSDATSLVVARAYEELKEFVLFPMPALSSVEIASDKYSTYEVARSLWVPTIKTFGKNSFDEVVYPAVVKNRHSIVWGSYGAKTGSASFVFSKDELIKEFEKITLATGEEPLVQEYIQGDEFGVEMLCKNGEVLVEFAHKRIRSLSPRGGAGVVKETAPENQQVKQMCTFAHKLVKQLLWTGPVMVEFKVNAQDQKVLLMEINGRFWGSLPLAVNAQVDFPYMTYLLARERPIQQKKDKALHVRTRHFLGDVKWLLSVFFAHDPLRKLVYPSRLSALYDFKKEYFISKGDVFSLRDLKPSLMEYIDILNK